MPFEQLNKFSEKLQQNAKEISGKNRVSFAELFPDDFISQHTKFQTIQQMTDAGGLNDPDAVNNPEWSSFVAANSNFSSWDEMLKNAMTEWAKGELLK